MNGSNEGHRASFFLDNECPGWRGVLAPPGV